MSDSSREPIGFDPQHDVILDANNLRGLAHPLRLRLLSLLREHGPATATTLAERAGESSGAASYHLRQLAAYGFIVDEPALGTGKERVWRSAHRSTYFDAADTTSDETRLLGEEYLRAVARANARKMEAWVDTLPTLPPRWRDAGTVSDYRLRLSPARAKALIEQLDELGRTLRDDEDATHDPTARDVSLQFQVLPDPVSIGETDG